MLQLERGGSCWVLCLCRSLLPKLPGGGTDTHPLKNAVCGVSSAHCTSTGLQRADGKACNGVSGNQLLPPTTSVTLNACVSKKRVVKPW